jgi:hypothetical protein
MPGKRFRYRHGPHRVRVLGTSAGQKEVIVETDQGIRYSAPMAELRAIPQKSTRPRKKKPQERRPHRAPARRPKKHHARS